jgi:hypothetical protein
MPVSCVWIWTDPYTVKNGGTSRKLKAEIGEKAIKTLLLSLVMQYSEGDISFL